MRHLLASDWVRFGRRRDLWILVGLIPIILAVMFVVEFNTATTPPTFSFTLDPPDPANEALLRAQMLADWRAQVIPTLSAFAFPASLLKVAGNLVPVTLLAIYVTVALVAGEFEWGTVRTLHLTSGRGRVLAVRVIVAAGLIGVATVIGMVFAAILPFVLSFQGVSIQQYAAPVSDFGTGIALRLAAVLPLIAVTVLAAVMARSIGLAFLFALFFFTADLAITAAPFWRGSPLAWIPAVTASGSIARLLGNAPTLASIVPAAVSFAALVCWSVLPVVAAISRFQRLDLNE